MSPGHETKYQRKLDVAIVTILTALIAFGIGTLSWMLAAQYGFFQSAVSVAQQSGIHSLALLYMGTWQASALKLISVVLSFLLIYAGTLFVLRTAVSDYRLGGEAKEIKAQFSTTSPGLALVTLGVITLALALYKEIDLKTAEQGTKSVSADQTGIAGEPPQDLVQFGEKK